MSRYLLMIGLCAASALAAFRAGQRSVPASAETRTDRSLEARSAAPTSAASAPGKATAAPAPVAAARATTTEPSAPTSRADSPLPHPSAPQASAAGGAESCAARLQALTEQVGSDERQRREIEGQPIKQPPANLPERLAQGALTAAMTLALQQSKVPGRIETIDCAEYPCILYGRIQGDEDNLERIERARAFAPYRADLMTLLSWTQTDPAFAKSHPGDDRPERLLFAIAFYTREDRARWGDNLDRRIRVRTADLWNALRPDDED